MKVYNSVQLGKPGPGLSTSNSLKIMKAQSHDLVETGAVAAVIPSTTTHATKHTMDAANAPSGINAPQ